MIFKSKNNNVRLNGFVNTDPQISNISQYAIEFQLAVPRPVSKGERQYHDFVCVYVSDYSTVKFCKENLQKGKTICVKGELRKFKDGSYKVCSSDVTLSSNLKY